MNNYYKYKFPIKQEGIETFYKRDTSKDSEMRYFKLSMVEAIESDNK